MEASDTALGAEAIVNPIRVERVVCEGVHSLGWSEQLEGPFGHDQGTASLQTEGAIALCDDGAGL